MPARNLSTILLAAGEGTRMKSMRPKVLHEVAHRPMVVHVAAAAHEAGSDALAIVVGPGREDVVAAVRAVVPSATSFTQYDRLGTAHAVLAARAAIAAASDDIIIAFGDTPLVTADTFRRLRTPLAAGAVAVVAAFEAANPTGYGRVLREGDRVVAVREDKDANPQEKRVTLCNGGLMALAASQALPLLDAIGNANAKGEYYLTDVVEIAAQRGLRVAAVTVDEADIMGVNSRAQLADAEAVMQRRLRSAAMEEGATLVAPETVFFAHDTRLSADTWVGPHVVFGPGVSIETGVEIHAFSHLAGCTVARGARIGPFARIRPKSRIGADVHVGNFVEVNRTALQTKVEANHLAYLGDATIGEGTNVGAGTITCNFDGADKHPTVIGKHVFVGSNATLVAPLKIGDEVLIAAGSTVTADVPDSAMVFGRAQQVVKPERGKARIRDNRIKRAARKAKGG
jgi:bifunctional UDP-N-acetylglucosamine pyrophosphorylase/glucosamine-1-phosphate N-acetyltransferase